MVKKIKKKIKINDSTRYVISLAMVVSPLYEPERKKPYLFSMFDPPTIITDFFTQHFNLDLIVANRFVELSEYSKWLSSGKSASVMKAGLISRFIHFPVPTVLTGYYSSPDIVILPMLGIATEMEWEEQMDQWNEGFSEIQTTIFCHLIEPELGIVPGVDRCLFMGPAYAKNINQIILYLHGRVSSECQLNNWPEPPLFSILDFKIIDQLPLKTPVSF